MLKRRPLLAQHQLTERGEKSFQLLELLRQRSPLTRTELSQRTSFNIVTVSNYITQFIKDGLVLEKGFDISTGGRKPTLVELHTKAGFAVGIDLGPMGVPKSHTTIVMTDLRGVNGGPANRSRMTVVNSISSTRLSHGLKKMRNDPLPHRYLGLS